MNNYCNNCNLHMALHIQNCPLCGKYIDGEHDPAQNEAYPKPDLKFYYHIKLAHILTIALLIGTIICLVVDLFFARTWWSMYVVASAILAYLLIVYPVGRKIFYWKEIFLDIIAVFLYVLFLDLMTNWEITWSIVYVIPIVFALFSLVTSIVIIASPKKTPSESLLALLIVLIFSFVVFMLSIFVFSKIISDFTIIPSFIALVVSAACLVFIALFRFKHFVKELFKQFRF